MATTKETFDTAIASLKSANPGRADLHKAIGEFGSLLGMEQQRLGVEEREDVEAFLDENKADWDAYVSARGTARAALKPKNNK